MLVKKDKKFTDHDRVKETAIYIAACPETEICIENTPEFSQNGVAAVKTFSYTNNATQIKYNKWIVENAEMAEKMKLPGYEKHNHLVQGSGVRILSKKFNHIFNFYGEEAKQIINACEQNHMQAILKLTNNLQR